MKDSYARTNNICLVFLTLVTATFALIYMKPVLIPLIFSIFVYSILRPVVTWVQNKARAPKGVAIVFSLFLLFFILTVIVLVLITSVENFVEGAPKYKQSLTDSLRFVESQLLAFNINLELSKFQEVIQSLPLLSYAQKLTGHLLNFLGNLFLVFIFTIFMMTGESRSKTKSKLVKEVLEKVSSYVGAKFILSLITGFLVWLVLLAFGVELAFIFALLTVLFNFIPTIGSLLAVALPLPIVFLQFQFGWNFFTILAITGAIQFTVGNVIEPKVMGESMDLHPITVLICLIFWGMVWGVAGMFLAVPITAVLKIIFNRIEATQPLAEILAGRLPSHT